MWETHRGATASKNVTTDKANRKERGMVIVGDPNLFPLKFINVCLLPPLVKALRCWSIFVWLDLAQSGVRVRANLSQLWWFHTWKGANLTAAFSLCFQHKYLKHSSQTKAQTWVNKSSAAISYMERGKITGCLTATAQPGTIISVLAMHTAQITHKHLKNVAHILHEYLSNTLHQSAKVVWTNMSMRKGCPMKLSIGFFLVIR